MCSSARQQRAELVRLVHARSQQDGSALNSKNHSHRPEISKVVWVRKRFKPYPIVVILCARPFAICYEMRLCQQLLVACQLIVCIRDGLVSESARFIFSLQPCRAVIYVPHAPVDMARSSPFGELGSSVSVRRPPNRPVCIQPE